MKRMSPGARRLLHAFFRRQVAAPVAVPPEALDELKRLGFIEEAVSFDGYEHVVELRLTPRGKDRARQIWGAA